MMPHLYSQHIISAALWLQVSIVQNEVNEDSQHFFVFYEVELGFLRVAFRDEAV
jgi:hypothetical protein